MLHTLVGLRGFMPSKIWENEDMEKKIMTLKRLGCVRIIRLKYWNNFFEYFIDQ